LTTQADCIFCRIINGELDCDKLFEDDAVLAFRDLHPQAPLHGLVIPKRHVATLNDFADDDSALLGRLMQVARQIAAEHRLEGYRIAMNVNSLGGQVVFHAHLHVLGGRQMKGLG
jgi:histidine triad (HIT) family protein